MQHTYIHTCLYTVFSTELRLMHDVVPLRATLIFFYTVRAAMLMIRLILFSKTSLRWTNCGSVFSIREDWWRSKKYAFLRCFLKAICEGNILLSQLLFVASFDCAGIGAIKNVKISVFWLARIWLVYRSWKVLIWTNTLKYVESRTCSI